MKNISLQLAFAIIILIAGCSGPKIIAPPPSSKAIAEKATAEGNYEEAVKAWKNHFSEQTTAQIPGADYATAAQMAYKSGDSNQAISFYDQSRYKNFASAEMYSTLAKIYKSQQNISKELSALEFYSSNFTNNLNEVNQRLFAIYFELKLTENALETWQKMDEKTKNDISNLKMFFTINQQKENAEVCDSLSLIILEKEPANVDALEWNGKKYYWLGENRYQREMEKYNKNKTNKQYKILLAELDLATADFKKALPYFEKLWEFAPGEKYASYFMNIYARFGDETKVNYYKKYMK
jgi:tetratricopeptide (TPR) repeat protein